MAEVVPEWLSKALGGKRDEFLPSWLTLALEEKAANPAAKPKTKMARRMGPEKINFATTSRGIRNHNPGNIEIGDPWQGRVADTKDFLPHRRGESRFVVFESPEFGIRAITKIMQTYRVERGLTTVTGIITRWAPPEENDTDAYIKFVSEFMGVDPDKRLDTSSVSVLNPLVTAIIRHENTEQPYSETTILTGISLAFNTEED